MFALVRGETAAWGLCGEGFRSQEGLRCSVVFSEQPWLCLQLNAASIPGLELSVLKASF